MRVDYEDEYDDDYDDDEGLQGMSERGMKER